MTQQTMIAGAILLVIGLVFIFAYKQMAKGMANMYKKMYTEKNLTIMLRIAGFLLILAGLVLFLNK